MTGGIFLLVTCICIPFHDVGLLLLHFPPFTLFVKDLILLNLVLYSEVRPSPPSCICLLMYTPQIARDEIIKNK